jgi:hypothetical protein
VVLGKTDFEPPRHWRAQTKVDVIPKDGGVEAKWRETADAGIGVGVALDDFETGGESGIVDRAGNLAEPAADRWNEAALA